MIGKFDSTLGRIGHTCSEFGNYFMSIQSRCFDCEGNPKPEDDQRDFREMMHSRPFGGSL